ncbi:MAG: metal-binding protein [Cyclobacteriaceae bacterium]|nr:metal-binding protein [Cyclobacteriaceae bacterium]
MVLYMDLGETSSERKRKVWQLVREGEITLGGNKKLKIYGTLNCASGQRMNLENRVLFSSEKEAIQKGYRPCGNCMKQPYQHWKDGSI